MPVNTKTKAVAGLALLDIARQLVTAWSAKREAERDRLSFGHGLREDTRRAVIRARNSAPELQWSLPPWRSKPSFADRMRTWGPVGLVIVLASTAVVLAARHVARQDPGVAPDDAATDSKVVGAVRAGSQAIDAGVAKVVEGGSTAAAGTASAIAAGSSAVRQATVQRAKVEVDHRVVRPAKKKAIVYGTLGAAGLTAYVIVIAVAVQLIVGALT